MIRFLIGRIAQGLGVVWGVVTIVFIITRVLGDPARVQLPITATEAQRAAFNEQHGYDRPILVQYADYLWSLLRGDFGTSTLSGEPAMNVALSRLPNTLTLILVAMLIAIVVGVVLGCFAAARPGGVIDRVAQFVAVATVSSPQFWVGLMLAMVFGVYLGVLPVAGTGGIRYVILPAIAVAFPVIGRIIVMVRTAMLEELAQPYILAAESRGVPRVQQVFVHALRNGLLPVISFVGWEFAMGVAGYATSVEVVFNWAGLGRLALESLMSLDFAVVQAIVILASLFVVLAGVAIDLLNYLIDPKLRVSKEASRV